MGNRKVSDVIEEIQVILGIAPADMVHKMMEDAKRDYPEMTSGMDEYVSEKDAEAFIAFARRDPHGLLAEIDKAVPFEDFIRNFKLKMYDLPKRKHSLKYIDIS